MKQITIKSALVRTVVVLLLTLETVSISAQYYQMVVHTDDGLTYPFNVNRIDSVSFVMMSEKEKTIEFRLANSSHSTKATISNNSDVANNGGFKVWGFKNTGSNWVTVLDGQTISSSDDGNTWTYSPKKYWDMSARGYRFYAAAPAENANGTIEFSDNTICVNNVHYMEVGDNEMECKVHRGVATTWDSLSGQVEFSIQHIMSRITIHFKKSEEFNDVDIKLKEISLEGWNGGNGNYKLNVTSSATDASEWTIPVSTSGVAKVQKEKGLAMPNEFVIVGDYLMIPQVIDADVLELKIKYVITYHDSVTEEFESIITLNYGNQMTWATGNCYDYFITFIPIGVTWDLSVSSWTEEIGIPVVP